MKRGLIIIFCLLFLFFVAKGLLNMFWFGPLYNIKSFSIFYGEPTEQKLKELQEYDAAIIEPSAFNEEEIAFLKKSDVKLFGYVSLMQLENWNSELKEHIVESDYALLDGKPIYIQDWDTYVMDLRESHYREALLWKINQYIAAQGLDGVFFDTVDDLDYYFHDDKATQDEMRQGFATLLQQVKASYPDLLIIQNRGFDTLTSTSIPYVDGVLWEGFDSQDMKESEWAKNWLKDLKRKQWRGKVRVWTVVTDEDSLKLSEKHRFPVFFREGDTYQE